MRLQARLHLLLVNIALQIDRPTISGRGSGGLVAAVRRVSAGLLISVVTAPSAAELSIFGVA